jgi:aryl-alcohol dehydrogenase-like predicted oxidoreductase
MQARKLGKQGLTVAKLGFGAMGLSDFYSSSKVGDDNAVALIHRTLELGITLIDTADAYGPFTNEVLVGKALRDRRDKAVIATKFGIVRSTDGTRRGISGKPEYVRECAENSLQRLGVDCIDLYYQHRIDPSVPIEDTIGEMAKLVKEGKVRYLGMSEAAAQTVRRAHAVHPISALQYEYSLWTRDPEAEILPLCRELGIGLVAYSPLGRGFLAGRFSSTDELAADDFRRHSPRFQEGNFESNLVLLEKVKEIAARKNCTPAQLALAWVMAQGDDIVPIPGTTNPQRLEENVAATKVELSAAELKELAAVMDIGVVGTRYDANSMQALNR